MLSPSQLRKHLAHVTQGQIQATLIATKSGEFLDYVVKNNDEKTMNVKSLCAVIVSVFNSYFKFSVSLDDKLNFVILDCDEYRMAIKPVGNFILCICADPNIGLGVLKLKMNGLSDMLSNLFTIVPVYS
jgi:predicted regulator of Ras-like GTPase activity (Roadblock/LC7/MglB family)